jgi:hypothetical protein
MERIKKTSFQIEQKNRSGLRTLSVQALPLLITSNVAKGKSLHLAEILFSHL